MQPNGIPAASAAAFTRFGFVNGQRTTIVLLAIQRLYGILGLMVRAHLHETKAFGATRILVHDDLG